MPTPQLPISLAINPTKSDLAAGLSLSMRIYDLSSSRIEHRYTYDNFNANVLGVSFSTTSRSVFCCSEDGTLREIDPRSQSLARLYKESCPIGALAVGDQIVFAGDSEGNVRLYDLVADRPR